MYNVAVNLMNSTKENSSTSINPDKKSKNTSEIQEREITKVNFWGQGAHNDDLNFFPADFYSFVKVVK